MSIQRNAGFTIVELLVVIVVIGVLASISLVSYAKVKESADEAAIISHVKQYASIFERYIVENRVPPVSNWRCLGDAKTLPAVGQYDEGYCFSPSNGGAPGDSSPADPALMDILRTYNNGSLPGSSFPEVKGFTVNHNGSYVVRNYRGMIYDGSTNNFPDNPAILMYYTNFPTCPIGERVAFWSDYSSERSGCAYKLSINEHGQKAGTCYISWQCTLGEPI